MDTERLVSLITEEDYRRYLRNIEREFKAARVLLGALQGQNQYVYTLHERAQDEKSIMEGVCDLADRCGIKVEVVTTSSLRIGGVVCEEISTIVREAQEAERYSATTDALGNIIDAERFTGGI